MSSDLLTLPDYLHRVGKAPGDLDRSEVQHAQSAITSASAAIRDYCDRDFTLNSDAVQGSRQFRYYGHGQVEIDDCTSVSQVATSVTPWTPSQRVLDASEWISGPIEKEIQSYIELWTNSLFGASPEMGFRWNADRYGYRPHPVIVTVTAVWGWPVIPEPIKQATVWVMGEFLSSDLPYSAESIEGYSHTFGSGRSAAAIPQTAVSVRAQSLLDPYVRVNV